MKVKRYLISCFAKRSHCTVSSLIGSIQSRSIRWPGMAGGVLLILVLAAAPAESQVAPTPTPQPAPAQSLRIATRLIKPDSFKEGGQIVGFSADLGQSILEELQVKAELETYLDIPEILKAVRAGQADLGIAAIAVTREREENFDFSHPILSGGLQIMVLAPAEQVSRVEQEVLRRLLDPNLLRLFGIITLSMLIPVHILWYFERHNKELIDNPAYFPGIFQALWWTLLALVGQAEEMPKGPIGRIVALFWVFVGIVFVSYFTAIITAELTVQELQGNIQGLNDLQNRRVAVLADGKVTDYLQDHNVQQVTEFSQPEQAYQALLAEEVDAVIAPEPLLLYYTSHEWKSNVQLVGRPFRERFYSIVMPKDSPYRKPINKAILTLKENGTYAKIYQKWFGVKSQD